MRAALAMAIAGAALAGCGGPPPVFRGSAFHATGDHYRVRYVPGAGRALMSADWELRRAERAERHYEVDLGGDARPELAGALPAFDLRFVHRRDGSVLASRTIPMRRSEGELALDVIAREIAEEAGGHTLLELGGGRAIARHRGSRVIEEHPVRVGGVTGWLITFEVLSLEQLAVDEGHLGDRATFVLLRPEALRWRPGHRAARDGRAPLLVVIALAGRADRHDAHLVELASFLGRLDFRTSD